MRRLLHLLYWQAQFDPRRPMLWLVGASYLVIAGPLTLGSFHLVSWRTGLPTSGSAYLSALSLLNSVAGMLFAMSQGSRAADERATGFLAAVQMTDLPGWTLTAFRGLGILVSGAPLWALRLPLYVWCYYLGGVRLSDFVAAECVAWVATAFAGGVAILCAQFGRSAQTAMMMIGGVLFASQAVFSLPRILMRLLRLAVGQGPSSLDGLNEWATAFSQWGLVGHVWNRPSVGSGLSAAMPALVLHLVVATAALVVSWRLAYFNVLPDDSPRGMMQRTGPPRRVSGDALAWQAVHLHHNRGKFRLAAIAFDLALLAALFISIFSLPPIGVGLLGLAIAFRGLTTAAMRAGVCVAYEIRDQTLSTLALLPREPLEFFRSWRRGGMRASRMEYI
ncbi:MAG TPA: hypothetical protein VM452_12130, partial [Caulifigura sp.]|nr:hypothetical protein [Caulifigura sp.]